MLQRFSPTRLQRVGCRRVDCQTGSPEVIGILETGSQPVRGMLVHGVPVCGLKRLGTAALIHHAWMHYVPAQYLLLIFCHLE